jgi:hypothetical protein
MVSRPTTHVLSFADLFTGSDGGIWQQIDGALLPWFRPVERGHAGDYAYAIWVARAEEEQSRTVPIAWAV